MNDRAGRFIRQFQRTSACLWVVTGLLVGSSPATAGEGGEVRTDALARALMALDPGDPIKVSDGVQTWKGRYSDLSATVLRLDVGGELQEIPRDAVRVVWERHGRLWEGVLKGLGVGTAVALAPSLYAIVIGAPIFVLGPLVGGGIGALSRDWEPVYDPDGIGQRGKRRKSVGSVEVQAGYGQSLEDDLDGAGGFHVGYYAWGGEVFSMGPEFGYQAMENGRRILRLTGQIRLAFLRKKIRAHILAGSGTYGIRWHGNSSYTDWGVGANLGAGLSYHLRWPYVLMAEGRYHALAVGLFDGGGEEQFWTVRTGAAVRW